MVAGKWIGSRGVTPTPQPPRRFGALGGVFVPSILAVLGVILYLRLGWVVGHAGLPGALAVIVAAHLLMLATGLSMSSLATGRTVGAGGAYYMVSRALGAPAGVAVGFPLYLAQASSVGFYVVGFAEVVGRWRPELEPRLVALAVLAVLTVLAWVSARLVIRVQYIILAAIAASLFSIFTGPALPVTGPRAWEVGPDLPLATVFAVFFPAVTGIMAGASMSGELRDPRRDIPLGTLLAIGVSILIYAGTALWLAHRAGAAALRQQLDVMWAIAGRPELISLGVVLAAASSALAGLLAAPRTLQAIAIDGYAPRLLAHGQGAAREPRWALLVTFALAAGTTFAGQLNQVAAILTMFFLVAFGATNLVCALENWAANPGFRPGFRLPWQFSGAAAVACFGAMGVIHWGAMLAALASVVLLYWYSTRRELRVAYGDDRYGIWAALVRAALYRLARSRFHPVSWRPNLVVYSAESPTRSVLLHLGSILVRDSGVVTLFHLVIGKVEEHAPERRRLQQRLEQQLQQHFPAVFPRVAVVDDLYNGVLATAQGHGVGTLGPNTVMLGWPDDRRHWPAYARTLRELLLLDQSLILVRAATALPDELRRIDIWWGGSRNTGAMLLLFGYLLVTHAGRPDTRLRLLAAARTRPGRERAAAALQELVTEARLPIEPVVVPGGDESAAALILRHSSDVDLLLIGVSIPRTADGDHAFMQRHAGLLEQAPTTLLVASSRSFAGEELMYTDEEAEPSTR